MSPRNWKTRIQDILDAILEINSFVHAMTFQEFLSDTKTIRAVELNFVIIGEAVSSIPEDIQNMHQDVPWHLMRGLRNQLVHAYFSIAPKILWDTIEQDLPQLIISLEEILTSQ
mgnify:CR=1 FL=1